MPTPDDVPTPDPAIRRLPGQPHLEHLRKQAKTLLRRARANDAEALGLVDRYDPGDDPLTLARA